MPSGNTEFCSYAQQVLEQTAGMLGSEIYTQDVASDSFTEFVEQEGYDLSRGDGQKYTVLGRADLRDISFGSLTPTDGTANPQTSRCEPPIQDVLFNALTTKTIVIQQAQIKSPMLCLEDLRAGPNAKETLAAYVDGLKEQTSNTFSRYNQFGIFMGAGSKTVATTSGPVYSTTFAQATYPATQPTGTISMALLETVQRRMNFNGADQNPFKKISNRPIHVAYLSEEALETVLRGDPKFRSDLRWADATKGSGASLMGPLGSVDILRSTAFMVIQRPRRFTYSSGTFTEVQPWVTQGGATLGTEVVPNPAYEDISTAPYEEILLPNKDSYKLVVPDNTVTLPSGMKYGPQTYRGEWHFKVPSIAPCPVYGGGGTTVTDINWGNIRENSGFFWAYFEMGRKFPLPQRSASIVFARCGYQGQGVSCGSYNAS